jgi:uncharacterized cupin superfamily protein
MDGVRKPAAPLVATQAPPRALQTVFPPALAVHAQGRLRRPLGDPFGLTNFGVNHTRLAPGAKSSLRHAHTKQDELVYVLEGRPTLVTSDGEWTLEPGMCAGFKAGDGNAHHLCNRTEADVVLLEVGDRTTGDEVEYPDDDVKVVNAADGRRIVLHKDGRAY